MTDNEKLSCLIDRPCNACKFHKEEGCSKWSCVFEEKSGVPEGEYIKKEDALFKKWQFKFKDVDGEHWFVNVKDIESLPTYSFPEREKGTQTVWEQWCEELKSCGELIVNKRFLFCNSGLFDMECTNVGNGNKCPLYGIRCNNYKEADKYLESEIKDK